MADTGIVQHFYLQLHQSVEGDPRIASLPPSVRDLFTRIRMMSLQGDCPGEINLSWGGLLASLGVRSARRMERIEHLLITERRLLSRGSKDEAEVITIACWTMPQLAPRALRDPANPRPKYPSDNRRRGVREEADTTQQSTLAQSFFNAPDQRAESDAESVAESRQTPQSNAESPYRREEKKEKKNNNRVDSATPHSTPQPPLTPEQIVVVASLVAEGIHPPVAERLARQGASQALVESQIAAMQIAAIRDTREGWLRRAIEAALTGHPYQPPHRHKPTNPSRRKILRPPPLPPGEAPPMGLLRGALTANGASPPAPIS